MRPSATVCALAALLLVSPALARPNLSEPIYLRRRSNPLEIVEESVESSTASSAAAALTSIEQQLSSSSSTSTSSSSSSSPTTIRPTGTSTPGSTSTHQPSYAFKRPELLLKTKLGTSGFVVSTNSAKVLTGGASAASGHSQLKRGTGLPEFAAKSNDQLFHDQRHSGHAGVAEPLTDEEYQSELQRATERVPPRTTTPREGLSTWVLLSGSDSSEQLQTDSTSTTRKVPIMKSTTTTAATTTSTTVKSPTNSATKRFQPTTRLRTTTVRPSSSARTTTPSANEEKKDKFNKTPPSRKAASAPATLKPVIVKKVKKPAAAPTTTTTTTTTTTPKPTPTTSSTTTEMIITEQSASTVAGEMAAAFTTEDGSSVESSTFLILEPKDALFDLPEDRSPAKTAPPTKAKKPARKNSPKPGGKKKPPGKKTRKPELKDVLPGEKKPPTKNKPVSMQIMNYLSREVMPTVGVGLVGLVMAAGLASYFLGSPLGALRRSDDRKDDLYFSNYEEYAGPDGQNEEDVFGKLIAGMPDRSYYRNGAVRRRTQQPVRTGHQYYHVQPYSANKYPHITYRNRAYNAPAAGPSAPETMYTNVNRQAPALVGQAKAQNEFYYNTPPTPYYTARVETASRPPAPVYSPATSQPATSSLPTTTTTTTTTSQPAVVAAADPLIEPEHELMPHPEAYSAEHLPEHHAHYVVDSGMDSLGSVPEHGPRRKRAAEEVELDNEIDVDEDRPSKVTSEASQEQTSASSVTPATEEETEDGEETTTTTTTSTDGGHRYTWGDFIRNTVERKVTMGLRFLQHVTMDFQRYLNGVQNHLHQQTTASTGEQRR